MSQQDPSTPPAELIDEQGNVNFGSFLGPIERLNLERFDYTRLGRWPWTASQAGASKLLKRWQFVGAMDENMVLGAAVVNLHYLGSGFAYAFDRRTNKITEFNLKKPLAKNTQFSASPIDGESSIGKGKSRICARNTIVDGSRALSVDFGDALRGEIVYREPGSGVSTVSRQSMYGFHYTYKSAGLPVEGRVSVNGEEYVFSKNALALLDWTASTPPRQT
ncbi:MAG: DUF2804 family protein, partial [Candidatus Alcyoniella australis]|nr:DUF2804 family protein [Candidatus Alcyoniella australis]